MYNAPKFWHDVNKRVRYYNWWEVLDVLKEEGIEVKKEVIKLSDYYCPLELKYKDVFKNTPYEYNSYNVLIRMNWNNAGTWHAHIPDQRAVVTVHFLPYETDADFIKAQLARPRKTPYGVFDYDLSYDTCNNIEAVRWAIRRMKQLIMERTDTVRADSFINAAAKIIENNKKITAMRKENETLRSAYVNKLAKRMQLKREAESLS